MPTFSNVYPPEPGGLTVSTEKVAKSQKMLKNSVQKNDEKSSKIVTFGGSKMVIFDPPSQKRSILALFWGGAEIGPPRKQPDSDVGRGGDPPFLGPKNKIRVLAVFCQKLTIFDTIFCPKWSKKGQKVVIFDLKKGQILKLF